MTETMRTEWWLMHCNFPDLNWARLRLYPDGSAEVFDMDGETPPFASAEKAHIFLENDEFVPWDAQDESLEEELGRPLSSIAPPMGETRDELLPQMHVRAPTAKERRTTLHPQESPKSRRADA